MFHLIGWIFYGLLVGLIAKLVFELKDSEEPTGCLATVSLGVGGSFVGGFINYLIGFGGNAFSSSGLIMSVVGSIVVLLIYNIVKKNA